MNAPLHSHRPPLAQILTRLVQAAVQGAEGRLSHISFVGNSLGGIYARAAAALLYNDEGGEGTVAGLRPDTFCTISTPHLGVRDFTYLPISQIPGGVRQGLTTALVGQTGRELMLDDRDDETPVPLVYRMATEERFLAPLRSFRRRRAYGNLAGDFMVISVKGTTKGSSVQCELEAGVKVTAGP